MNREKSGSPSIEKWTHWEALRWMALLYRDPMSFQASLEKHEPVKQLNFAMWLYLNMIVYLFLVGVVGRILFLNVVDTPFLTELNTIWDRYFYDVVMRVISGTIIITIGVFFIKNSRRRDHKFDYSTRVMVLITAALVISVVFRWEFETGMNVTAAYLIVPGIANGALLGIVLGILAGGNWENFGKWLGRIGNKNSRKITALFAAGVVLGFVSGIDVGFDFGTKGGLTQAMNYGVAFVVSYLFFISRLYYLPIHLLFIWPKVQGRYYRFHPVAWDKVCPIPFPGLHRLLLAMARDDSEKGLSEMDRLIENPSQRGEAIKAKSILLGTRCLG